MAIIAQRKPVVNMREACYTGKMVSDEMIPSGKYPAGIMLCDALLNAMDDPLPQDSQPDLEITLHAGLATAGSVSAQRGEPQVHIALRIGRGRMYVVRNMAAFLRALSYGERVVFGKGFALEPGDTRFSHVDDLILQHLTLVEAAQRLPYDTPPPRTSAGESAERPRKFFQLPQPCVPGLLRLLFARPFRLAARGQIVNIEHVERTPLPMRFDLKERFDSCVLTVRMASDTLPLTDDCQFVYSAGRVHALAEGQKDILRVLLSGRIASARTEIVFPPDRKERMISELLPILERTGELTVDPQLAARIVRGTLEASVYLDREDARIVARVNFKYDNITVDPFAKRETGVRTDRLLTRDIAAERAVLEELSRAGFKVRSGQAYLQDAKQTLAFFLEGVQPLMERAQVFCSDRFQKMRPRRPSLSGKLTAHGGFLRFVLMENGEAVPEALAILETLRDRRRYFRLKDGTFLDLEDFAPWQAFAESVADAHTGGGLRQDYDGSIETGLYRAPEWLRVLSEAGLGHGGSSMENDTSGIILDQSVEEAANFFKESAADAPISLDARLRTYQLLGFNWLRSLYTARMGGVLADDMGLGKTVQMISAICSAKEAEGPMRSLVIAPTSLLYNWMAEISRFAPNMKAIIIDGNSTRRRRAWEDATQDDDLDIIITSYPLLRRDIDLIEPLTYRMLILDEAQHIKNARSLASSLVKRLNAQARFALTGTPMENHPAELWSIFDFVLPGYLLTLTQFLARHGAGQNSGDLRRKVEPFLLRRLKKDVLPELPEKIEHTMWVDMPPEQRSVYQAVMLRARARIEKILDKNAFTSSRFEVLSLITELRQICCHPALRFEGYQGSSGKLDALADLLPGALENGRRILLFSQFTKMLKLLEERFAGQGISCMYLDGQTPTRDRLALAERFNAGEGQLFLISLKAGGSGLNLTGADMVIHYDPWWNPAVEEQAADRAHRIGQTRAVQVIRMIAKGSIEEQVDALRERKKALYDKFIPAEGQIPFTMEDVRDMFLDGPLNLWNDQ